MTENKAYFLTALSQIYSIDLELTNEFELIYQNSGTKLYPYMIWVSSNDLYTLIELVESGASESQMRI